jgi:hypothetical protein
MGRTKYLWLIAVVWGIVAPAWADDSPSNQPVSTPKQKMHECMAKQRAANSALSIKDMRAACQNQLRTQQEHPSIPPGSSAPQP